MSTITPDRMPEPEDPRSYHMAEITAAFPSQAQAADWLRVYSSDPTAAAQWEPAHRCWSATITGSDAELYALVFDSLSFVPLDAFDIGEG